MRTVIVCTVAAILSLFAVAPCVYRESHEEILCEICAIIDDSGEISEVKVTGRRFAPDAGYFTDIKILIDDGKEIIPETDEGYGAGVAAFDFKGGGYCQLFYFASSGGSGGFGYFYVFDCSETQTVTLFDYRKFDNVYTAEYADSYQLKVFANGKLFTTYNEYGDRNEIDSRDKNGATANDKKPYVTDLNFVEPVFVYSQKRYRLNIWQNVIGSVQTNVVGRIITTLAYDNDYGSFKQLFVSTGGKHRCDLQSA